MTLFLEIEPTDHPLGPNRIFVAWAKGPSMHLNYHGPKSRGTAYIDFTVPVKPSKPREDKAFGVHIAKNSKKHVEQLIVKEIHLSLHNATTSRCYKARDGDSAAYRSRDEASANETLHVPKSS